MIWLCQYAFPTIIIDFLYQITYFIAVMVLDERRVAENRRDCLICCSAPVPETEEQDNEQVDEQVDEEDEMKGYSSTDRFMLWFADKLLRPGVKLLVVFYALLLLGACGYSATKLTQEFDFTEVIPQDSVCYSLVVKCMLVLYFLRIISNSHPPFRSTLPRSWMFFRV